VSLLSLSIDGDRLEMLKWISERNSHIPISELKFLVGIPPFDSEEDDEWGDDDEWLRNSVLG
jgi:hypothetical protein